MTLQEFDRQLQGFIAELDQTREQEALAMASNALSSISARVINQGKKADGNQFPPYSETQMPVWFYAGKPTRAGSAYGKLQKAVKSGKIGSKKKVKSKATGKDYVLETASYKEWREVNNLPTDVKNFSFTGQMWQQVGVEMVLNSPDRRLVVVHVKGLTKEAREKLSYAAVRHGNILSISPEELDRVRRANEMRIQRIAEKYF